MSDEETQQGGAAAPGVRHAALVFSSPPALFRRVEDTGAYGWTLVTLLALVTLLGYAEIQTGLIDRVVDERTEDRLAELERSQTDLVDRARLRDQMEDVRKTGEFEKLMTRLGAVVASPAMILVSALLIASCLYAMVALTGRKPEYHTLMSICVYAMFVDLLAQGLRLGMMLFYRTIDVDTSLGMVSASRELAWLSAIDPFRIWFWVLVAIGLTVTQQLSRRVAIASCVLMCIVAMGVHAGKAYMTL